MCEWRQQHPDGRKADCHRDTGLDPKQYASGGMIFTLHEIEKTWLSQKVLKALAVSDRINLR